MSTSLTLDDIMNNHVSIATPTLAKLLNRRVVYQQPRPNGPTSPDTSNEPQRMEVEQPVYLQNSVHVVQTVDDYNPDHDNYVDQSAFAQLNDNCYVCASPLINGTLHVFRTACHCKSVIHTDCWEKLSLYSIKNRFVDPNAETMVRDCGLCRGNFFGTMDMQYDITRATYHTLIGDYNKYSHLSYIPPEPTRQILVGEFTKVMFSIQQIVKYIRRQWQSTCGPNPVIAELMSHLSICYQLVFRMSVRPYMVDGKPDQCLQASFDAGIFSLIQHSNSSIHNGLFNLDFLLVFMNEVDLPCVDEAWGLVINYLFELIVATTDASYQVATELLRFTSASTYDLQQVNSKDADIRRAQHEGAQWYLLGILNNDMLRTKTVEFAGFQERVRFFWNKAATWVGDERCPGWVEERQQFGLPLRWNPLENEYQSFGPMVIGSKNDNPPRQPTGTITPKQPDTVEIPGRTRLERDTVRFVTTEGEWYEPRDDDLPNNFVLDSGHVTNVDTTTYGEATALTFGMFDYILKMIANVHYCSDGSVSEESIASRKALMKQLLAHERACTAAQKRGQVLHLFKDRTEEGDGDRVPMCEKTCEECGWNDLLEFTPALPTVTGTIHFLDKPYH